MNRPKKALCSEYLFHLLKNLSFEDACRTYVLKTRFPQYLTIQPIERDEYVDGRHEHYFQKAMKRFASDDPMQKHCYSREELISETRLLTGLTNSEAVILLYRLFAFQPELTYSNRGALCKKVPVSKFELSDIAEISIPYDILKKELPDEWYISLQIPERIINRMVWGCRTAGSPRAHSCSSRFAEQILRLGKQRRGEFIQKYSFETLKFFWLEYGSISFPQNKTETEVSEILLSVKDADNSPFLKKMWDIREIFT